MQMLHSGLVTLVVFSTFVQLVRCNVESAKSRGESSSTSVPEVTNLITEEENRSFDETSATVSVGIRSFTVEVTTPFEKPSIQDGTKIPSKSNVSEVKSMNKTKTFPTEDYNGTAVPDNDSTYTASTNEKETEAVTTMESTSSPDGYEDKSPVNDIHIEKQLKNGLYRIKIAEIITDEFDNALGDDEIEASINRNKLYNSGKINIADLYPSQDEDFGPIIKESNERLLKDKHMFVQDNGVDDDGNLKPNSIVDVDSQANPNWNSNGNTVNIPTTKIEIELIDEPSLSSDVLIHSKNDDSPDGTDKITDFTKQLLRENDKIVSTIERSFVNVNNEDSDAKVSVSPPQPIPTLAQPVNVQIKSMEFIDRRVKKHDPTFKFKIPAENEQNHVDFANTKFSSNDAHSASKNEKPEFSTTKFYNSKELYSEMLHKRIHEDDEFKGATSSTPINSKLNEFATVNSDTEMGLTKSYNSNKYSTSSSTTLSPRTSDNKTKPKINQNKTNSKMQIKPEPRQTNNKSKDKDVNNEKANNKKKQMLQTTPTTHPTQTVPVTTETLHQASKKIDSVPTTVGRAVYSKSTIPSQTVTTAAPNRMVTDSEESFSVTMDTTKLEQHSIVANNLAKPYSRSHVLSRMQEKINALECDIQMQNEPIEASIWRGNETHELCLPNTIPENCTSGADCMPMIISWEGTAEIQSGDVLIVEIDDNLLIPTEYNASNDPNLHKTTTAVYQVTRPGHEHCDVTEGILLDITPLVVDGKKLVTLYDKDLTEGVNLLIVVSEIWGSQCVRLKVTVKSDNCGENADCSGKGICYSNTSMEGYECQCCTGFAGSHCEEIDACSPSPCTNNGICVDLSQGHEGNSYQCLCPYGYTGKNCQFESDPCNPSECLNGGSCSGNATHFRCECTAGYTGPLCQHNLNECESSPCVHGICVDQEDGFRCFCQPGFAGELCNFEYNECESNPCLNGGICSDHIGGFSCKCTRGYNGKRCHIKVDFCANNPCPEGHRCYDRGNDFTCECPGGRNGPDCNQVPRTVS
ncbi:hypothetical protein HA402_012825 [Bradysia odoriphaga]|nr:hypothetical protein HA402_012825 [Bradysia odoriphaga]